MTSPDPDLARVVRDLRLYAEDPEWSDIAYRDDVGTLLDEYDARARRISELEGCVAENERLYAERDLLTVENRRFRGDLSRTFGELDTLRTDLAALRVDLARSARIEAAVREVAAQWDHMLRCYRDSESSVRLGELLDAQCEALEEGT